MTGARVKVGSVCLTISLISACARPDRVLTVKSPTGSVFYTVETFYGHGAPDSDFTRVDAHLEADGKSDRQLALSGEYVELSRVTWTGPNDVTLCLQSELTDSFRNEITLISGTISETIRNHLDESCKK